MTPRANQHFLLALFLFSSAGFAQRAPLVQTWTGPIGTTGSVKRLAAGGPSEFTISGRATINGASAPGYQIFVTCIPPGSLIWFNSASTYTAGDGSYSLVTRVGEKCVVVALSDTPVTPSSTQFASMNANQTVNFAITAGAASTQKYTVSGQATALGKPVAGAIISAYGSGYYEAVTGADGRYSVALPVNGTYKISAWQPTPGMGLFESTGSNSIATAGNGIFAGVNTNQAGINFLGYQGACSSSNSCTLGGQVTLGGAGLPGITVSVSLLGGSQTTVTDAGGFYSFTIAPYVWWTVVPVSGSYSFQPVWSSPLYFVQSFYQQNFTAGAASASSFVVANVGSAGQPPATAVTITVSGTVATSSTTGWGGSVLFTNLPANGTYTLTATAPGMTFTPAAVTITPTSTTRTANFVNALAPKKEYIYMNGRAVAIENTP